MSTEATPVCQSCAKQTKNHCTDGKCLWVVCRKCMVVYGPTSFYAYGLREANDKTTERRKNGL